MSSSRRRLIRSEDDASPALVQAIENNLLLHQALGELKDIKTAQGINHLVSLALKEHNTIERVDSLWAQMGQVTFLLRTLLGIVSLLATIAAVLVGAYYLLKLR
ncbi:MAG: hypothetical protein ACRETG_09940 [Steroidobacteraceae bacterium]